MNVEQARFNMIEQQIRPWNVLDPAVLSLLSVVKREDFLPAAQRSLAFMDVEIPLPGGQVMLAPRLEARLLQDLALHRHEKVLEIGTGSGFMAALLAHRAQQVVSWEIRPELVAMAKENLRQSMVMNVEVRQGDAAAGDASRGPWDAILLSGSVHEVPQALLGQLKVGGRLVAIVGDEPMMRALRVVRLSEQEFRTDVLFDTVAPRLEGFAPASRFHF
ncbi:MAG: protein-L-isoaspartate O-methyltransferase [Burkholderiales bacterium]|jgi:protein-L-isoaspartate(D-aspartate) O-methyltransferase|nr:protein-L-isoaspartate O-methyltransferase [Burkholderiales bacterium]MBP6250985.1 protein-L-isoaspartate O-methyltransferase [Leptothrix sp. (in: b-proteobacteria)]MBP7522064.1 protein-L-isoaspartate O-methyltransferase [Leptothrix sp. (in: b-proteobacteria)]